MIPPPTPTLRITLNNPLDYLDYRDGGGGTYEIFDIAVGTERGQGRGRRLMQELFKRLVPGTRVWAITRASNCIAQQFYEALHFRVIGVLREFYSPSCDVDAIMYGREVGGAI